MSPEDIPARHDRLAAAMLTPLVDHGLRAAVKWVLEPELLAMETEIERRVRAKVAKEILSTKGTDPRFPTGWASTADRDHAANIARGEA